MRRPFLLLPIALLVVAGACGTRVDESTAIVPGGPTSSPTPAALQGPGDGVSGPGDGVSGPGDGVSGPGAALSGSASPAAPSGLAPSGTASGQSAGRKSPAPSPAAAGGPVAKSGTRGSTAPPPAPPSGTDPGPAVTEGPTGGGAASGRPGSTVKIGSVGTISGPIGSILKQGVEGLQIWGRAVNARGGLKGRHPVEIIVADDGGDPARHRSQVQQLVEQEKVVAFVSNVEILSGEPSVDYITTKRVPVIGGSTGESWFYSNPMYFPHATHGRELAEMGLTGTARQWRARGMDKVGLITCTEARLCQEINRDGEAIFQKEGMQVVYRAQSSLAQPDFTAECLAASNRGAEAIYFILDANSIARFGKACARQSYRPSYGFGGPLVVDQQKEDPNLDGTAAISNVFPYFQTGTPATDEFHAAIKRFAPGYQKSVGTAIGWTAAKLFERAAEAGDPTTSAGVLEGLWSIKGDTLGGITVPLTFTRDQPAKPVSCWFPITIADRQWKSLDNFKLNCR